jgi:hypothetical protein
MFLMAEEEHPILKNEGGWRSKTLLVLEFMIEYTYHREDPFRTFSKYGKESKEFHQIHIEFLAQTKFDDYQQWTDDQLDFYEKRSYPLSRKNNR